MVFAIGRRFPISSSELKAFNLVRNDDAISWSSSTAYVVGDRARIQDTLGVLGPIVGGARVYECIRAHTDKNPADLANLGTFWVFVSYTGDYVPFDDQVSQTPQQDLPFYYWRLGPSAVIVQYVGVFGAAGDEMIITRLANEFDGTLLNGDSENFQDAALFTPNRSSITGAVVADPLTGLFLAQTLKEDATAANTHTLADATAVSSYTNGQSYNMSIYVKQGSGSRNIRLTFAPTAFGAGKYGNFTLSGAGTAAAVGAGTSNAVITALTGAASGWYRCSVTCVATSTITAGHGLISMLDGALSDTFNGNNTSTLQIFGLNVINGTSPLATYMSKFSGEAYTRSILLTHEFDYDPVIYPGAEPYNPNVLVATGSTPSDHFEVHITRKSPELKPRIGEIAFLYDVATFTELIAPLADSLLDFSNKDRDPFGNVRLVRRPSADNLDYTFMIDKSERQRTRSLIRSRVGQPLVFFDTADLDNSELSVACFGFIQNLTMPFLPSPAQIVTLDTEGLT